MSIRQSVLSPLNPYYEHAGTWQSWHMFVGPHRNPAKLYIDLDVSGQEGWQPLYTSRHPEHRWKADLMDHSRTRAALFRYSWRHYRTPYRKFSHWLAQQAADEFPDGKRLRLRWYRYQTPTPTQVLSDTVPAGKFERMSVITLAEYR